MKTILVVEDEVSLLDVVKTKLEKSDFTVLTSRSVDRAFGTELKEGSSGDLTLTSVQKALKYLESLEQVDAIWLDHNLIGKENGLDFVKRFKDNGGRWSSIPIFVVSNTSDQTLVKQYKELGISKYFIKAEHKLESIIADIKTTLKNA